MTLTLDEWKRLAQKKSLSASFPPSVRPKPRSISAYQNEPFIKGALPFKGFKTFKYSRPVIAMTGDTNLEND